jgi:hypothetical protein
LGDGFRTERIGSHRNKADGAFANQRAVRQDDRLVDRETGRPHGFDPYTDLKFIIVMSGDTVSDFDLSHNKKQAQLAGQAPD